jgi:hypothetical protein
MQSKLHTQLTRTYASTTLSAEALCPERSRRTKTMNHQRFDFAQREVTIILG